ncbi:hypothetical protein, partial [Rhodococcus erythropolis]|uniref:hypothetical protein n=1 Tax=Rhodococcus erythropolis TaxID=1833 RepID=UPI00294B38C3
MVENLVGTSLLVVGDLQVVLFSLRVGVRPTPHVRHLRGCAGPVGSVFVREGGVSDDRFCGVVLPADVRSDRLLRLIGEYRV